MSTPDYYKYDDGETHFECFDISRYYSGDWAQVIQYVFRWEKKGGIKDLEKALACANDAYFNGIECKMLTHNKIVWKSVAHKIKRLSDTYYADSEKFWCWLANIRDTEMCINLLEEMIDNANKTSKSV
ncbi:hypothetical protein ACMZ87_03285 [Gardnerella pickettii]|uniref:hypothetical protein n=1 Tax=Gardnerella pickettii TaxID=2914924 RepID=UPI0039EE98E6